MALTQAELESSIDALDRALATRERSVQFADRNVVYRSTEEMLTARDHLAGLLARLLGRPKQTLIVGNKGF